MGEKLLDELIRNLGFENAYVITFARMVERNDITEDNLQDLYDSIMTVLFN